MSVELDRLADGESNRALYRVVCVSSLNVFFVFIASAPLSRPSHPRIREDRANPSGYPVTYGISSFWLPRIQLRSLDFAINSKFSQKIAHNRVLDRSGNFVRFGWF